jgi:hypothetical protein
MRSVHIKIGIIDFRRLRAVEMTLKSALHRSKALISGLFKQPLSGPLLVRFFSITVNLSTMEEKGHDGPVTLTVQ